MWANSTEEGSLMAIRWDEFLANIERYKKALPPDEPIVLPRREAKRRAVNKEKRHRVIFDCDEETYKLFHQERSRYIAACGENPTIAHTIMIRLLQQLSDSSIAKLAADEPEPVKESLGDA
jgi:hypothetical protein